MIDEYGSLWDKHVALRTKYQELILAVTRKFQGETRHETALRFIRQAETAPDAARSAEYLEPGTSYGGTE